MHLSPLLHGCDLGFHWLQFQIRQVTCSKSVSVRDRFLMWNVWMIHLCVYVYIYIYIYIYIYPFSLFLTNFGELKKEKHAYKNKPQM